MSNELRLEQFAALQAEIDGSTERDVVLAREGVPVATWERSRRHWLDKLAAEASTGGFVLRNRYDTVYTARRRTVGRHPRPSPVVEPRETAAPSAEPERAPQPPEAKKPGKLQQEFARAVAAVEAPFVVADIEPPASPWSGAAAAAKNRQGDEREVATPARGGGQRGHAGTGASAAEPRVRFRPWAELPPDDGRGGVPAPPLPKGQKRKVPPAPPRVPHRAPTEPMNPDEIEAVIASFGRRKDPTAAAEPTKPVPGPLRTGVNGTVVLGDLDLRAPLRREAGVSAKANVEAPRLAASDTLPLPQTRAEVGSPAGHAPGPLRGRNVIAVVGIDRYRDWPMLSNAVSDAKGALGAFLRLGFVEVTHHLFDEAATGESIKNLATDDLKALRPEDSLVLFLAGHGHTHTVDLPGGQSVKTGYLVPVDASRPSSPRLSTLVRLDNLLEQVAQVPARHVLVIIDACHSGIALALTKWRDFAATPEGDPRAFQALTRKRSRRVITSALDDQRALDSGPMPRHSLFTGALLRVLNRDRDDTIRRSFITGSELGLRVQHAVSTWPSSQQTPDFGALPYDDRGEMLIPLVPVSATSLASQDIA